MDITFNSLPYEIQMQICSYLSWAELHQLFAPVCKKWKLLVLASKHSLVKDILIDGDALSMEDTPSTKRPSMENIIIDLRKCYKLQIIGFYRIPNWYALSRGLPAYNYLRRLEFHECKMSPVWIKRLVARFPAIEGVELQFRSGQVDFSVIKQITKWRRLKDILIQDIGDQPLCKIGTDIVETFATNCEHLRSVEMINICVWGRAITTLTDLRKKTLEKLNLTFRNDAFFLMEADCFAQCLGRCTNLKVLYVTLDCRSASFKNNLLLEELHVTGVHIFNFLLREVVLKNLTKLEIVYSPSCVELLPTHCPALRWLAIRQNNTCDDDFVYIARNCRNLEHMVFEWCSEVTLKTLGDVVNLETTSLNCVEFLRCAAFKISDDYLIAARTLKPDLTIVIEQCGVQQ